MHVRLTEECLDKSWRWQEEKYTYVLLSYNTRSSATADKQCVRCACLSRLAECAMHRTLQNCRRTTQL